MLMYIYLSVYVFMYVHKLLLNCSYLHSTQYFQLNQNQYRIEMWLLGIHKYLYHLLHDVILN